MCSVRFSPKFEALRFQWHLEPQTIQHSLDSPRASGLNTPQRFVHILVKPLAVL